jgi:hypothetical protein
MSDRRYSRVYWSVQDDPKFDGIREDMRHMGTWLTLLLAAEQSWPAPAYAPPIVSRTSFRVLVEAGLVDELSGGRYRIHGLDNERGVRSQQAADAAAKRWHSDRNATASDTRMPSKAEQSKDEKEQSIARESHPADDGRADLEAFLLITRKAPTPRQRALLDGLLDRHDLTGPKWAADIMMRHPDDPIGAVIEADKAWRAERIAEAQASEKPKPVPRRPKGLPTHSRELLEHWAATAKGSDDA